MTLNPKIKLNLKKLLFAGLQLALLLLPYFKLWSDQIFLLGLAAILLQGVFSLRFTGWAGSAAYSLTCGISAAMAAPEQGDAHAYWHFGYFAIVLLTLVADLILKFRRSLRETEPEKRQ